MNQQHFQALQQLARITVEPGFEAEFVRSCASKTQDASLSPKQIAVIERMAGKYADALDALPPLVEEQLYEYVSTSTGEVAARIRKAGEDFEANWDKPLKQQLRDAWDGETYHELLALVWETYGGEVLAEAQKIAEVHGKFTWAMFGAMALRHDLPFKALVEFLEEKHFVPFGVYERFAASKWKVKDVLEAGRNWLDKQQVAE
jgi:hypothetical protein